MVLDRAYDVTWIQWCAPLKDRHSILRWIHTGQDHLNRSHSLQIFQTNMRRGFVDSSDSI
jgi:hypothetical protein